MNFFNSIFSDDPEPSNSPRSPPNDPGDTELDNPNPENPNSIHESSSPGEDPDSSWSFGGLIKTITTRSESVIGNYRRDFEEFGSGLLKETALIRDVASRAVQEFPDSIDSGAAAAQESLESVGQAIDSLGSSVWQGTNQILARGKELHLFDDDDDDYVVDNDGNGEGNLGGQLSERNLNVKKYSWFDTRMREIQADPRTYTEETDDFEDYKKWKSGLVLDEKGEEIGKLMEEERVVERIYLELVPVTVDRENFWSRYLYKVDKLKQAEEARARIVKRAISGGDDDEDLSWDVDDDDDDDDDEIHDVPTENSSAESTAEAEIANVPATNVSPECASVEDMPKSTLNQEVESKNAVEIADVGRASDASETNVDAQEGKCSEGKVSGEKNESYDSCKDGDVSITSTQPSLLPGGEELGWDEIEDVGSDDGNKVTTSSSSNIPDLHKRLNPADEEEDLSWDIEEEDDEPIKS